MSIAAAVKRGCEWLDANKPGWVKRISMEGLRMGSCHACVLGKVFGHYLIGRDMGGGTAWAYEHGFTGGDNAALEAEWKREIARRNGVKETFGGKQ